MKLIRSFTPDNIFLLALTILAAFLNMQLLEGSNIDFQLSGHDEYIAVREVYFILHPISYKHFFMALISGDILYYGRIMFYIDALVAFIPFKLFGLNGLVYAVRMMHVLTLMAALAVLGRTFLTDWKYRTLFYLGTATLYYSFYFFMVPKPDPMQLLVLAIFFYYFKRSQFRFGIYFILLGIAYGIKFNIITLLPWLFVLPFITNRTEVLNNMKQVPKILLYCLMGLVIAVPCLLLSPLRPVFLKSYLGSTFGYVEQYDDDLNNGISDWLVKGWFGAYNGGIIAGAVLILLILVVLYFGVREFLRTRRMNNELIVMISGLFLFIPVILLTKRIWPHYLWSGYIFIFLGIIIYLQNLRSPAMLKNLNYLMVAVVLTGTFRSTFAQGYSLLTIEKDSKELLDNGHEAYRYLKGHSRSFTAIQDLAVPYPFEEMLKTKPYHPFSAPLNDMVTQKFIWQGFISPKTIAENLADYIITAKTDFNDSTVSIKTMKDATLRENNALIRKELGKTIFPDTSFGKIRIYRVIKPTEN